MQNARRLRNARKWPFHKSGAPRPQNTNLPESNMKTESIDTERMPRSPRQALPQVVFGFVAVVTLVVLFYAIENWRGRRAWEKYKAELTARGEELDWNAYIPKQIPDEENMLKVPLMAAWFPKDSTNTPELAKVNALFAIPAGFENTNAARPTLLEVHVIPTGSTEGSEPSLSVDDFTDESQLRTLAYGNVKVINDPRGLQMFGPMKGHVKRVALRLKDNSEKTKVDAILSKTSLGLVPTGESDLFRLTPISGLPAQAMIDFLKQHEAVLGEIEKASRRSGARFEGDFLEPFSIQVPSFVRVRSLVQTLGSRADAEILLNQPEAAAKDVSTILRIVELLNGSQPTLLCKMIGVAIVGLAEGVVQEGFQESVWKEEQLRSFEEQFGRFNLLNDVSAAMRGGERAGVNFMIENYSRSKLVEVFETDEDKKKAAWRRPEWLYFHFAPRGWFYQNETMIARVHQMGLDAIDLNKRMVKPGALKTAMDTFQAELRSKSGYNAIASRVVANYFKAIQTACRNQTFVDELRVACALDRYYEKHQDYPDTLEVLVPLFIKSIPRDVISGQPLKYQRKDRSSYLLYGVGWDGADDGGVMGKDSGPDWVWRGTAPVRPREAGKSVRSTEPLRS